jgi:hypothetical protein
VGQIKRLDIYVSDILDPHRVPRRVYHDDQAPLAIVNRKGEPPRVLPTLVSRWRMSRLSQMEELCGMVGLEEVEPSSPDIQ